ncbi:hypothetical protein SGPA1_11370 [Streptomyces misionensis JCM 4497]
MPGQGPSGPEDRHPVRERRFRLAALHQPPQHQVVRNDRGRGHRSVLAQDQRREVRRR